MNGLTAADAETLELLQQVGVGRFSTANAPDTPSPSAMRGGHTGHDDGSDVLALIQATGLTGFDPDKVAICIAINTLPAAAPSAAQFVEPQRSFASSSAPPPHNASSQVRLSHQEFAVLTIASGGASALAALEAKMGVQFAGDNNGKPYWSEATSASDAKRRAFAVMPNQKQGLLDLRGDLGSADLRLSFERIDVAVFKQAGPGATGWAAKKGPPQLPQRLPDALRSALGR